MDRDHFWLTDKQFAKIGPHLPTDARGGALGLDAIAHEPDFATNKARVVNRSRPIPQISAVTATMTREALGARPDAAGVPSRPQTYALDMTVRCESDDIDLMGIPLACDGARPRSRTGAPALGQHNAILG